MFKDKKWLFWAALGLLVLIFCYFRIKPVLLQTIPFTFDQGRDLLRAWQIAHEGDLAVLGPTTGIPGLYHGPWWYYALAVPILLTGGNPINVVFVIIFTTLIMNLLFTLFLKKEFGELTALFFFAFVTVSPYFIGKSFFLISSIFVFPFLLLLFYALYSYLKKPGKLNSFLIFLALGFIFEAEIAMGIMLIPAALVTMLIFNKQAKFFQKKYLVYNLLGFVIPTSPHIIYELRTFFLQSKAVVKFLQEYNQSHPADTIQGLLLERARFFWEYYLSLFPYQDVLIAIVFGVLTLAGILLFAQKKDGRSYAHLLYVFLITVIVASFLNSHNFFWANYLEGLPYLFLLLITLGFHFGSKAKQQSIRFIAYGSFIVILGFSAVQLFNQQKTVFNPDEINLREINLAVDKIYTQESSNQFCVNVYTPPIIPHTYNYIFTYQSFARNANFPSEKFVGGKCWFIVEDEPCVFLPIEKKEKIDCENRIPTWKKSRLGEAAKLLKQDKINNRLSLELWEKTK